MKLTTETETCHWAVSTFFNRNRKYNGCKISKQMTTDFSWWLNHLVKIGKLNKIEAEQIYL